MYTSTKGGSFATVQKHINNCKISFKNAMYMNSANRKRGFRIKVTCYEREKISGTIQHPAESPKVRFITNIVE